MNALHSAASLGADLLWRASWQGGLAVLAVALICWLIPQIPARFQAWCWRLALLKFAVVLVWLAPAIEIPVLEAPRVATVTPDLGSMPVVLDFVPPATDQPVSGRGWELWPALLVAWCLGVGWHLFALLQQGRQAALVKAATRPVTDRQSLEQYDALCRAVGVHRPPPLLEAAGDGSPFLLGLARPAIVLPAGTWRQLTPPERALVLEHELAHYLRGDLPWGLFAAVVRALLFFHPAVWWAEHQLRCAQEAAADALTIGFQQGDAALYAARLVTIVSKLGANPHGQTFQVAVTGTQASLQQRLFVMRFLTPVSHRQALAFTLVLGTAAIWGIVPWTLVAAELAPAGDAPVAVPEKQVSLEQKANRDKILDREKQAAVAAMQQASAAQQSAKLLLPSLGQKREDIVKKFGEPAETETFQGGIESLRYKADGARCYVEISPTSKQAIQVYYFKKTAFTAEEIKGLLARNAEGATWTQSEADQGSYHYRRSDQGFARGGQREDEYMFAILSGSEVTKKR